MDESLSITQIFSFRNYSMSEIRRNSWGRINEGKLSYRIFCLTFERIIYLRVRGNCLHYWLRRFRISVAFIVVSSPLLTFSAKRLIFLIKYRLLPRSEENEVIIPLESKH